VHGRCFDTAAFLAHACGGSAGSCTPILVVGWARCRWSSRHPCGRQWRNGRRSLSLAGIQESSLAWPQGWYGDEEGGTANSSRLLVLMVVQQRRHGGTGLASAAQTRRRYPAKQHGRHKSERDVQDYTRGFPYLCAMLGEVTQRRRGSSSGDEQWWRFRV
jgi:hypothetical protein